jgi:hypothetical protein
MHPQERQCSSPVRLPRSSISAAWYGMRQGPSFWALPCLRVVPRWLMKEGVDEGVMRGAVRFDKRGPGEVCSAFWYGCSEDMRRKECEATR